MLTWRTAVIAGVVALAFAVVAPSVRAYMDQQVMLDGLRAEAATAQAEVDDLEADVARWDDPAFVVAQARERLAYVFPGETPYRVIDPESVTGPVDGSPAAERAPDALTGAAWYDRLWGSVIDAGERPGDGAAPAGAELPEPPEVKVSPAPAAGEGSAAAAKVDSTG
ncbi:hypothetical protein Dac01nite_03970 [Demequina activiva]|uniref:Septum formation initiator n=2 Tax=Demequina activiva TaxID=1582364 RepID=A0A919Q4E2_9MICO|nr:hypothetical protein Dac01nite_03970 [Demequina activiva]